MSAWVKLGLSLAWAAVLYWVVVVNGTRPVVIWISTIVFSLFAVDLAGKAAGIAWHRKRKVFRRSVRVLRQIRRIHTVPPLLSFLHASGFAACFAYTAAFFAGYQGLATLFLCLLAFFLSIAGLVDLIIWGNLFFRNVWNEVLGKIFAVSVGAALLAGGISVAKNIVHSITHVDPKYFIEATALLSSLLVPAAYCLFGMALLYLFSLIQLLRFGVFVFGAMLAQQFVGFVGPGGREKMRLLWYRLANGKRPVMNQIPKKRFLEMAQVSLIAKPISTICLTSLAAWGLQGVFEHASLLRPLAEQAIVQLEYRTESSCAGLEPGTAVAYMDDGKISKATRQGDKFSFTVGSCNFPD